MQETAERKVRKEKGKYREKVEKVIMCNGMFIRKLHTQIMYRCCNIKFYFIRIYRLDT